MIELVRSMVYSKDFTDYQKSCLKLQSFGDIIPDFVHYFDNNWNNCKEIWVQFFRDGQNIFGTHTCNFAFIKLNQETSAGCRRLVILGGTSLRFKFF